MHCFDAFATVEATGELLSKVERSLALPCIRSYWGVSCAQGRLRRDLNANAIINVCEARTPSTHWQIAFSSIVDLPMEAQLRLSSLILCLIKSDFDLLSYSLLVESSACSSPVDAWPGKPLRVVRFSRTSLSLQVRSTPRHWKVGRLVRISNFELRAHQQFSWVLLQVNDLSNLSTHILYCIFHNGKFPFSLISTACICFDPSRKAGDIIFYVRLKTILRD